MTGQDLKWFFNQWFYAAGHPRLEIAYTWDETTKKAGLNINQTQTANGVPGVFDLPLAVDIYDKNGKAVRKYIRVTKRSQSFTFDAPDKPVLINVDANKTLLCEKKDDHTNEEWAFQYRNAPLFRDRWDALEKLQSAPSTLAEQVSMEALKDKSAEIRLKALSGLEPNDPRILAQVENMAANDPDHQVRATCIGALAAKGDKKYVPIFEKGMAADQPYSVASVSLEGLLKADSVAAMNVAKSLQNDESNAFTEVLSSLYAESPRLENLPFFEKKIENVDGFPSFPFFNNYQKFLLGLNDQTALDAGVAKMKSVALNLKTSQWRRFATTKAIADIRTVQQTKGLATQAELLDKIIAEIKDHETDPMLKSYYSGF